jgi:hypothetical protein
MSNLKQPFWTSWMRIHRNSEGRQPKPTGPVATTKQRCLPMRRFPPPWTVERELKAADWGCCVGHSDALASGLVKHLRAHAFPVSYNSGCIDFEPLICHGPSRNDGRG